MTRSFYVDQLVSAHGRNAAFRIHRLDTSKGTADLRVEGTNFIEENIPLNTIEPMKEDVNQASARIVREATED